MGLAASQARLLTITSRKSDCEYQSMALSHQKIALARDMNIVSAEYQDSLSKTKLVYDFYGNGDTSTDLTYGLLMSPSELNNYMPCPVTDPSGRIVLDPALAAAAKAAGIPQEGLGCTPSSDIRDRFIDGLMDNGVITKSVGNNVKNVQYNPTMGLGTIDFITTSTETIGFQDFINEYLANEKYDFSALTTNSGGSHYKLVKWGSGTNVEWEYDAEDGSANTANPTISIADLINGNYALYGLSWDKGDIKNNPDLGGNSMSCIVDKVGSCSFWDGLFDTLESVIDHNDNRTVAALEYAKQETLKKVVSLGTADTFDVSNAAYRVGLSASGWWIFSGGNSMDTVEDEAKAYSRDYVGYVYVDNYSSKDEYNDGYNINLSNMTKAFYTYFAQYMQGLVNSDLCVTRDKATSNFVTDFPNNTDFSFDIVTEVDTTGNNMLIAGFYDALFNQIATKGWVENEKVNNKEYMQTMMKNGTMYISSVADDDYYYMANYATNQYIKEITDEEGIAIAEAKYQREKSKINSKENILDMKMKNLDTEITSLTTEYETVKSVISNNVKTGFSRYKA
ncbi:hypothetical protein IKP85_04445 [bacterium]|nr:hypothetical protein [bacterium]